MGTEIENLQELLKEDPSNFQARRELAVILADNGFNEEALVNIEYLVKYFPEDADLYYNLGILYEKTKNLKKAEEAYEKAISIQPQDDFYYNLGEVLVSLEDWDNAAEAFNKVLKNDPNDSNCYFNLGLCYYHKDEIKLATDNFQRAIELNPDDYYAEFYLGNIYQQNGLTNFAEDCYKKVLAISPDYSWAYYNLAAICASNNNYEEASEYLLKAIEYNETDIESWKLLTKIYIKQGLTEEIISKLETRISKDENGDLYYILASVYRYIGDKDNYVRSLKNAVVNQFTLTFPKEDVTKELEYVDENYNSDAVLEPEEKIEEYSSDNLYDDEKEDEIPEEENAEDDDEEDDFDFEDDDIEDEEDEA